MESARVGVLEAGGETDGITVSVGTLVWGAAVGKGADRLLRERDTHNAKPKMTITLAATNTATMRFCSGFISKSVTQLRP